MKVSTVAVLVLALLLGGCTWFRNLGKKDNVEPPTPLAESFTPTLSVQRAWTGSAGKGPGKSGAPMVPAVADGRLFVADVEGNLSALDAATGKRLWNVHTGKRSGAYWRRTDTSVRWSGGPTVAGDLVIVGGLDGQVGAYAAADGAERWVVNVSSEVITAPAVSGDTVIVRSNDGRLYGLDLGDGSRRWVFDQGVPPLSLRGNSAPRVSNGLAVSGFDNGKIVAVNIADGSQAWMQTLGLGEGRTEVDRLADVDGEVVVDGGEVFAAGYRGIVSALYADSGRTAWQRDLSSYAGVTVAGNVVAVVDDEGNVWAFDRQSGANLWKQDQLKYRWLSSPAAQGGAIVVGDVEGWVHWLNAEDGKLIARERLGKNPIAGAPVVDGDTVYVEDSEGRLGAWRVAR